VRQILSLAWAEVLHVVRDRATLAQVLMIPIVQLLILTNAATFQIRDTPAYIVDQDHTPASRGLITRFAASGHFKILGQSASADIANAQLLRGKVTIVLTIPNDFEKSLMRIGSAPIQITMNAEKGSAAGIIQFYAGRIISAYSRELTQQYRANMQTARGGSSAPMPGSVRIDVRSRSWYNPTLDYKHYMVPGILVALVTLIGTLLTAQNLAREKELGTLEQLNVTPITRVQLVTAKLLPFWVLAVFEFSLGLALGKFVFGMPVRGSLLLLFGVASVYLIAALGIGFLISTFVETQQQAMFVTFFVVIIYFLLSGLFTPLDSMPHWVQMIAEINPVRHFVAIVRAILIKGAGFMEIARSLVILSICAVIVVFLAAGRLKKQTA
jgi:ABC-2 type transport system permease protein